MQDLGQSEKSTHVILSTRDLALMCDLHDYVVMSYEQIAQNHFARCSHPTVFNRLKKLQGAGFISRHKVNRISTQAGNKNVGVVFQLSTKGRRVLAKLNPNLEIFEKTPFLQVNQLDHDLLLGDIGRQLKTSEVFLKNYNAVYDFWLDGKYLNARSDIRKIPDAVIKLQNDSKLIAIELELTVKSERRYREIVSTLRTSSGLGKVIFITPSRNIAQKIKSAIVGYNVAYDFILRDQFFEVMDLKAILDHTNHKPSPQTQTQNEC